MNNIVSSDRSDSQNSQMSDISCTKCKEQIISGNFYTINNFHYHSDCFNCFKCQKSLVPKDSSGHNDKLLVLENGTLICAECSDSCIKCGKKIYDLAIILSSNEAYCPDCFKCTKCDKKITDLKYAKTKNGIFCIDCHQILLQKRKMYKARLANDLRNKPKESLELPIRSPSRKMNRDIPIYNNPQKNTSSSSSSSLLSSAMSNQTVNSHRTNNTSSSNPNGIDLNQQNKLKLPPTLLRDATFSTLPKNESVDEENYNTSTDNLNVDSKNNHTRNISIDDMLNATLDNDAEFRDSVHDNESGDDEEYDATDRSFLHMTPVKHNMESIFSENSLIESYENESMSMIPTNNKIIPQELPDLPTNITSDQNAGSLKDSNSIHPDSTPRLTNNAGGTPLNSPMAISRSQEKTQGLALDLPLFYADTKQSTLTTSNSSDHGSKLKESLQHLLSPTHTQSESAHTRKKNGFISSPQKSKKLNRSFSLKSSKFFGNLRNKSSESPKSYDSSPNTSQISGKDIDDTYSGWGVRDNSAKIKNIKDKPKFPFKGRSDTLIYHRHEDYEMGPITESSPIKDDSQSKIHNRTQSTTSQVSQNAPNIAIFRTPPLDTNAIFKRHPSASSGDHSRSKSYDSSTRPLPALPNKDNLPSMASESQQKLHSQIHSDSKSAAHHRSISWQTILQKGDKSIDETDEHDSSDHHISTDEYKPSSVRGDLFNYELKLRKVKLDLNTLDGTKQQLLVEIENLNQSKNDLIQEIESLKATKERQSELQTSSDKSSSVTYIKYSEGDDNAGGDINGSPLQTPVTYIGSSPQSTSKQKFWKLFSKDSNSNYPKSKIPQLNYASSNGYDHEHSSDFNNSVQVGQTMNNGGRMQQILLKDLCRLENTNIPHIVTKCIDYIESDDNLLQTEGLYRKSGSQAQLQFIESELYGPNKSNYQFSDEIDIHIVTNLLKRFLRRLQIPVLTFEIYEQLINLVKENDLLNELPFSSSNSNEELIKHINDRLQSLLFHELPLEHLNLLKVLINHVKKVAGWKDFNLMTLHNLSLVFTPSLLRDKDVGRDVIDMKERNYLIEYLFTYYIID